MTSALGSSWLTVAISNYWKGLIESLFQDSKMRKRKQMQNFFPFVLDVVILGKTWVDLASVLLKIRTSLHPFPIPPLRMWHKILHSKMKNI